MLLRLRCGLLFPLLSLLACGSSSPSAAGIAPTTGAYVITLSPQAAGATLLPGALSVAGTSVTGAFSYYNPQAPACGAQTFSVSGTINSNDSLALTSSTFAGSVASFTIQLPLGTNTAGTTSASGTGVITGGSCALASTTLQLTEVAPYSGTWTGTASNGSTTGTVNLVLNESAANSAGQFPVSAVLTFSAPTCSFSINPLGGEASGYNLLLSSSANTVTISSLGSPANFTMNVSGVTCPSGSYSGTITP
jgi:hypothetical protein